MLCVRTLSILLLLVGSHPQPATAALNSKRIDALLKAAESGHTEKVQQLLASGPKNGVNAQNHYGSTALMKAAWHGKLVGS
jgi:ankyrin repeat protein